MYTLGYGDARIPFFFWMNQDFIYNVVMNAMLTVVFLNEFVSGVGIWAAINHVYRSPLVVIDGNLNAQRYHDDILTHHVIPLFHNNANISIFQHDNATSHTTRDTVKNVRTNNIDFTDDWHT